MTPTDIETRIKEIEIYLGNSGMAEHYCAFELLKLLKKSRAQLRFAAGCISTTEQFKDKHPQDALEWIEKGLDD